MSLRNKFRVLLMGSLVAAAFAFAPAALARGHVSIGIGLPGLSLGYSDCRHCGGGFYGGAYWGGYATAYAPAYYGAVYAPAYYGPSYGYGYGYPAYYSSPVYGGVYYSDRRAGRRYYSGRYEGRGGSGYGGGNRGHRAQYYDRSGSYRH